MAINITALIPAGLVRQLTDIGNNYNQTLLSNAVNDAQELELVGVMNRPLFDALVGHVIALRDDSTAIPIAYNTLLNDFVAYYLVWVAYYNVLESLYLKPTSVGAGQRNFNGGTPISAAQYETKRNSVRSKVDHYATRLQQYLSDQGSEVFVELSEQADLPIDRIQQVTSTSSPLMTSRRGRRGPNLQ